MSRTITFAKTSIVLFFTGLMGTFFATSVKAMEGVDALRPLDGICGVHSCYYNINYVCTNQGCASCANAWCIS